MAEPAARLISAILRLFPGVTFRSLLFHLSLSDHALKRIVTVAVMVLPVAGSAVVRPRSRRALP
jgi:hypothetical protein